MAIAVRRPTRRYDKCRDVNECLRNPCVQVAGGGTTECVNTVGGYECRCADSAYAYQGALGCVRVPGRVSVAPVPSPTPAPTTPLSQVASSCNAIAPCGPGSGDFPQTFCSGDGLTLKLDCNDGNSFSD